MVTVRNKYRNHRNKESYDNWGEEATDLNQSSKIYSIIRDVSGKLATSTVKLINEWNGESLTNKDELIKE